MVARGAHGRAIREQGLQIDTLEGSWVAHPKVIDDVAQARGMDAELALVAVKTYNLHEVAAGVGAALRSDGRAIPLLNGLDSEEELGAVIGRDKVIGGISRMSGARRAPGHIALTGPHSMLVAALEGQDDPKVASLAETLDQAGLNCNVHPHLKTMLWEKLVVNAPMNAICALADCNAGAMVRHEALCALFCAGMAEVIQVGQAEGAQLSLNMTERVLDAMHHRFPQLEPSMLQDMRARRPTEARGLQGAVVERGKRQGIATPIHQTLLALMLGREPLPS